MELSRRFWRSGLSRQLRGGFTRDKSLPALRTFEVLRIYVRSLFWRDAVAAVWAGSV